MKNKDWHDKVHDYWDYYNFSTNNVIDTLRKCGFKAITVDKFYNLTTHAIDIILTDARIVDIQNLFLQTKVYDDNIIKIIYSEESGMAEVNITVYCNQKI